MVRHGQHDELTRLTLPFQRGVGWCGGRKAVYKYAIIHSMMHHTSTHTQQRIRLPGRQRL